MDIFSTYTEEHIQTATGIEFIDIPWNTLTGSSTIVPIIRRISFQCTHYISQGLTGSVSINDGINVTIFSNYFSTPLLGGGMIQLNQWNQPIYLNSFNPATTSIRFSADMAAGEKMLISIDYEMIPATHNVFEAAQIIKGTASLQQNVYNKIFTNNLTVPIIIKNFWLTFNTVDAVVCVGTDAMTYKPQIAVSLDANNNLPNGCIIIGQENRSVIPPNYSIYLFQSASLIPIDSFFTATLNLVT